METWSMHWFKMNCGGKYQKTEKPLKCQRTSDYLKLIKHWIYWFEKNYLFEKMCVFNFSKLWYAFHTVAEHGMRFIPLQKWYDIILCSHSSRRVQTLMVSWLWKRVIYVVNLRVLVAMVTRVVYSFHFCDGMKCISCSAVVWNAYQC